MTRSEFFVLRICLLILFSPSLARGEGIGESLAREQAAKLATLESAYAGATKDETKIELRRQMSQLYQSTENDSVRTEIHDFLQTNAYPKSGLATVTFSSTTASAKRASRVAN